MIEVGEYIRFGYNQYQGHIRKVIGRNIDNQIILDEDYDGDNYLNKYEEEHDIRKHSKNIIDVIEIGDIVNGEKVREKLTVLNIKGEKFPMIRLSGDIIKNDEIRKIITHELDRRDCYRVEEDWEAFENGE